MKDQGLIARLPGGEAQRNESDIECVHRERREETGLLQEEFDTPLIKGYTRPKNGRKYRLHVFLCGVEGEIPIEKLTPKDPKILGHMWVALSDFKRKKMIGDIRLQPSHIEIIKDLEVRRPDYVRELGSWIRVQEKIRSAS
jgi:8-oxo-dGTP pyrophosphatase MutT (NUDIX family)